MRYPSRSDYCCSIRNPAFAFRKKDAFTGREINLDSALVKGSAVERVHASGLRDLWSASGSFAIAFKYETPSPQTTWAVRCFYRSTFDVTQHYRQALRHLKRNPCQKYFVRFDFLQEGIRVQGKCYPILKMEWVEGANLKKFIKANLRNPSKLRELADRWVELVRELHLAGIAHGDFQHGNVLVVEEFGRLSLKLIDYDSLYFAKAHQNIEDSIKGISNYQHPLRKSLSHRCLEIDAFPALIIYLSILALERNPKLWSNYDLDNTEGLLFEEADFLHPQQASIFRNLKRLPRPISSLAQQLQEICALTQFEQLPSLDEVIIGRSIAGTWAEATEVQEEAIAPANSEAVAQAQNSEPLISRIRIPKLFSNWSFRRHSSHQIAAPSAQSQVAQSQGVEEFAQGAAVQETAAQETAVQEPTLAQPATINTDPPETEASPSPTATSSVSPAESSPNPFQNLWQRLGNSSLGKLSLSKSQSVETEAEPTLAANSEPIPDTALAPTTPKATEPMINLGPVAWSPKTKRSPKPATAETQTQPALVSSAGSPGEHESSTDIPSEAARLNETPGLNQTAAPTSPGINWPVLAKELLEFGFRFSLGSVYLVAIGVVLCLALPFYAGQPSDDPSGETITKASTEQLETPIRQS